MTPDEIHILDSHPKYDDIIVGCGFSGTIIICKLDIAFYAKLILTCDCGHGLIYGFAVHIF